MAVEANSQMSLDGNSRTWVERDRGVYGIWEEMTHEQTNICPNQYRWASSSGPREMKLTKYIPEALQET